MKGSDVVSRARLVLNDADAVRWTDAEFVNWINDGCRYIALNRPDSCVVNGTITLAAGSKQSIAGLTPPGLRLLDVVRATASGRAIRLVDRETLDTQIPSWHAATQAVPTNYVFDNRDPQTFYVYPPAIVSTVLEIVYSRVPVEITTGTLASQDLTPADTYIDPLLNYVLFRAYSKDADFAHNANLAALYIAAVDRALGVKTRSDAAFSPDLNSAGGKVNPGTAAGGV